MQIVPLSATPSQSLNIVLAQQNCMISVYQKSSGVFFDLTFNNAPVVSCVIARDNTKLLHKAYSGFVGDFMFFDAQKNDDPAYIGFGSRWFLIYLEAADV